MRCLIAFSAAVALLTIAAQAAERGAVMKLESPAFSPGAAMPVKYTCDGVNVSPPLSWNAIPAGTKSFVLIVDDPDAPDPAAPKMVWVHWVVYNIPASVTSLPEAVRELPAGTQLGVNDWKKAAYGGPCPPIGRHRYFHTLYALDTVLAGMKNPSKADVLSAIKGHVLAKAELIGTYQRGKN